MANYEPTTEATRLAYEKLLRCIKRWCPPGLELDVAGFAHALIQAVKKAPGDDRRSAINRHFNFTSFVPASFTANVYHDIIESVDSLSDFFVHDDEEEYFDEEASEGAASSEDLEQEMQGFYEGGDMDDDDRNTKRVAFADVLAAGPEFLTQTLRYLDASMDQSECLRKAKAILTHMEDQRCDRFMLITLLQTVLDTPDDARVMDFVETAANSRWAIVFGLRYAAARGDKEKSMVLADLETLATSSTGDVSARALFEEVTGRRVDVGTDDSSGDEYQLKELDNLDRLTTIDDNIANTRPLLKGAFVVEDPPGIAEPRPYEEIVIPEAELFRGATNNVPIAQFPEWCQKAFGDRVTMLNRMQSVVYPKAFESDQNLLICAPTGAGKTNVAMMTILRCLTNALISINREGQPFFDYDNVKMIYVAPLKALVKEVTEKFSKLLEPLNISVAELSGDASLSRAELSKTQLIVTTPEKWDVVTRKSMDLGVAAKVRLIIIDEVHLLHNERGAVLESLVARFMMNDIPVRFVGLSATLPNYRDVAKFLRVDLSESGGVCAFDSTFREVPMRQSFCLARKVPQKPVNEVLNEIAYEKAMAAVRKGDQAMIFVHSRKDTQDTARWIVRTAEARRELHSFLMRPESGAKESLQEKLSEYSDDSIGDSVKALLLNGVGIHHAGLKRSERDLVESSFSGDGIRNGERLIKILVCTSTLAWGVNLPANTVVIKGTQVYSSQNCCLSRLSILDVQQMFGRAGRFGLGGSGTIRAGNAIIVTNKSEDRNFYLNFLNQQMPIESQFMKFFVDAMNAEVVLGTIRSIKDAVKWLQQTYFYVRLREKPANYGAQKSASDPFFMAHLHNLAHTAAVRLHNCSLVVYDQDRRELQSTDMGRIASHFYVSYHSMSTYLKRLHEGMHDNDLFHLFSLSQEFANISVRVDEADQISELLTKCPVAVEGNRYSPESKINVLLQCYIADMSLNGLPLMSELVYIKDSAQRILRAIYEISLIKGYGNTARRVLGMYRMVLRKQWAVQSPLRQVRDQLSMKAVARVEAGGDWQVLRQAVKSQGIDFLIERLHTNEREAPEILRCVRQIPAFEIAVAPSPISRKMLLLDIVITPDFDFAALRHAYGDGALGSLVLTVELASGRILHTEPVSLPRAMLEASSFQSSDDDNQQQRPSFQMSVYVPIANPKPCFYFVRLESTEWIGCEAKVPVDLISIALPRIADPPRLVPPADQKREDERDVRCVLEAYHLKNFEGFFEFDTFNVPQADAIASILTAGGAAEPPPERLFIGFPPGCGKTALAELFLLNFLVERKSSSSKAIYLTSRPEVAKRRFDEWREKFGATLRCNVVLLSGDIKHDLPAARTADIIISSAAGLQPFLNHRALSSAELLAAVTHLVVDHAHMLRDASADSKLLECTITRLWMEPLPLNGGGALPKLLVLSLPLIDTRDVAEWLNITATLNYDMRYRGLAISFESCSAAGYHNRYTQAAQSVLKVCCSGKEIDKGSRIVFVPSVEDAKALAERLYLLRGVAPADSEGIDDAELATVLAASIGYISPFTSDTDLFSIFQRAASISLTTDNSSYLDLVVFATFDSCWRIPASLFPTSVVCLAERAVAMDNLADELSLQLFSHCSVTELLQMVSRAAFHAHVLHSKPREWLLRQFLLEPLPLEPNNSSYDDFADTINAAVAQRASMSFKQARAVVKHHYFAHHLRSNPSFYNIKKDQIAALRQGVADEALLYLQTSGCVTLDTSSALVATTPIGTSAMRNGISTSTVNLFRRGPLQDGGGHQALFDDVAGLLWFASLASELRTGAVGDATQVRRGEANALRRAARDMPEIVALLRVSSIGSTLQFTESHTKTFLLALMSMCRLSWVTHFTAAMHKLANTNTPLHEYHVPSISIEVLRQLDADTKAVRPTLMRVIGSAVHFLPLTEPSVQRRMVTASRLLMKLHQMMFSRTTWSSLTESSTASKNFYQLRSLQSLAPSSIATFLSKAFECPSGITVEEFLERIVDKDNKARSVSECISVAAEQFGARNEGRLKTILTSLLVDELPAFPILDDIHAMGSPEIGADGTIVIAVTVTVTIRHLTHVTAASPRSDPCWITCFNRRQGFEQVYCIQFEEFSHVGSPTVVAEKGVALISAKHSAVLRFPADLVTDKNPEVAVVIDFKYWGVERAQEAVVVFAVSEET